MGKSFNSLNYQFKQKPETLCLTQKSINQSFFLLKITTILWLIAITSLLFFYHPNVYSSKLCIHLQKASAFLNLLKKKNLISISYKLVLVLEAIRLFLPPLNFDKATSCFFLLEDICLVMLFMWCWQALMLIV